jgi:lipid-A-disaccharide synthase
MVVGFKANPISFHLVKFLVKVPYISQPNLLANERLVPEFIQKEATVENLSKALIERLDPSFPRAELLEKFTDIHKQLRQNAGNKAAQAIIGLCSHK